MHTIRNSSVLSILAIGPTLCVLLAELGAGSRYLPAGVMAYVLTAILLAWSPLPISIPAVLLGEARDRFEPGRSGPGRGWRLLRHLGSKESAVRVEFLASLIGFAAAVLYVAF